MSSFELERQLESERAARARATDAAQTMEAQCTKAVPAMHERGMALENENAELRVQLQTALRQAEVGALAQALQTERDRRRDSEEASLRLIQQQQAAISALEARLGIAQSPSAATPLSTAVHTPTAVVPSRRVQIAATPETEIIRVSPTPSDPAAGAAAAAVAPPPTEEAETAPTPTASAAHRAVATSPQSPPDQGLAADADGDEVVLSSAGDGDRASPAQPDEGRDGSVPADAPPEAPDAQPEASPDFFDDDGPDMVAVAAAAARDMSPQSFHTSSWCSPDPTGPLPIDDADGASPDVGPSTRGSRSATRDGSSEYDATGSRQRPWTMQEKRDALVVAARSMSRDDALSALEAELGGIVRDFARTQWAREAASGVATPADVRSPSAAGAASSRSERRHSPDA